MERTKNALLIIDAQEDFCNPAGSLYVPGAEKDMERLSQFIKNNIQEIDFIGLTVDSHQILDISHPKFWKNKQGDSPSPFTIITLEDVKDKSWVPLSNSTEALFYLRELKRYGEFTHCIWPEHCIKGTWGANITQPIIDGIQKWHKETGLLYQIVSKGYYPLVEHFGAFRACVSISKVEETQWNYDFIKTLEKYDNVYLAGEAQSHCVAFTLKQAMQFPKLAKKLVILEDCMSDVPTFELLNSQVYTDARKEGIRFINSSTLLHE
jgi:nicotinamidase-related amidase